jgi:hypothetical protein
MPATVSESRTLQQEQRESKTKCIDTHITHAPGLACSEVFQEHLQLVLVDFTDPIAVD